MRGVLSIAHNDGRIESVGVGDLEYSHKTEVGHFMREGVQMAEIKKPEISIVGEQIELCGHDATRWIVNPIGLMGYITIKKD